jgi:hypothetical protein
MKDMLSLHRPVQFPLFSTPHQKATSLRGVAINARPNSCSMKNGHKQSHPARSPHFVQKYRANDHTGHEGCASWPKASRALNHGSEQRYLPANMQISSGARDVHVGG